MLWRKRIWKRMGLRRFLLTTGQVKSAKRGWGWVEPELRSQTERATVQSTRRCWWVLGKLVRQREQEGVKLLGKRGLGALKESC